MEDSVEYIHCTTTLMIINIWGTHWASEHLTCGETSEVLMNNTFIVIEWTMMANHNTTRLWWPNENHSLIIYTQNILYTCADNGSRIYRPWKLTVFCQIYKYFSKERVSRMKVISRWPLFPGLTIYTYHLE